MFSQKIDRPDGKIAVWHTFQQKYSTRYDNNKLLSKQRILLLQFCTYTDWWYTNNIWDDARNAFFRSRSIDLFLNQMFVLLILKVSFSIIRCDKVRSDLSFKYIEINPCDHRLIITLNRQKRHYISQYTCAIFSRIHFLVYSVFLCWQCEIYH